MNLDDPQLHAKIDTDNMLEHIDGFPEQLQTAWHLGMNQPLPEGNFRQVLICGMGGSAIGGDLLAGLIAAQGSLPVSVVRGYTLPAWAKGDDTLVIGSSFSGNTEESVAAIEDANSRGLPVMVITTGGKIAKLAQGKTLWQFEHVSPPRAALGWSLGLLLALAHRMGWLSDLEADIAEGIAAMQAHRDIYQLDNPAAQNPAKRQGGQFVERFPVIYGAGVFEVVARRWKTQLNENASHTAFYEPMPEADHNGVVGVEFPPFLMSKMVALFLRSDTYDHPRVRLRHELTAMLMMQYGIAADYFLAEGRSLLAQMLHAIQFGDYVSYYTAIAQGANPTTIEPIDELKAQMSERQ
jgi:glucose/mannose-6-phosphate isomerase